MFTPDFSKYSWAPELAEAAFHGADEARRFARRVRGRLADDEADRVGEELVLLMAPDGVPDFLAALTAAAIPFAGPRTIARAGDLLRRTRAEWQIVRCLEILEDNHGPESAVQQLLCAREAADPEAMQRAARMYRFGRYSIREISTAADADVPFDDLERYFGYALETAMLEGARFVAADFERTVSGPANSALRRALWARYHGRKVACTFIMDPEDAGFLDVDLEPVVLPPSSMVGLVHPAELGPTEREVWGLALADHEVVGLFTQLDRPCERAKRDFPYGELNREAAADELYRALLADGWNQAAAAGSFEFRIRGACLKLQTNSVAGDVIRLERLTLSRPTFDRDSREDDIIYNEALTATTRLLTALAPDLV